MCRVRTGSKVSVVLKAVTQHHYVVFILNIPSWSFAVSSFSPKEAYIHIKIYMKSLRVYEKHVQTAQNIWIHLSQSQHINTYTYHLLKLKQNSGIKALK